MFLFRGKRGRFVLFAALLLGAVELAGTPPYMMFKVPAAVLAVVSAVSMLRRDAWAARGR